MNKIDDYAAIYATSNDLNHPIEHIFESGDIDNPKYWCSTGLYPQIFMIEIKKQEEIQGIRIKSQSIKSISVYYGNEFDNCDNKLFSHDVDDDITGQDISLACEKPLETKYLKFSIDAGYNNFIAIYDLKIDFI